jgi:hypothetical protein
MSSIYTNVLSNEDLDYLNNHPEVLNAKSSLDSQLSGCIYFSVPITNSIRTTLESRFGLQLSLDSKIPMRWIKGDTAPHVDTGSSEFKNTYLMYLNDSPGELIVDSQSYPIQSNSGFVFNKGILHGSKYTENIPRLLLGPMNEFVEPVGRYSGIYYYSTQTAAETTDYENEIGFGGGYVDELSSSFIPTYTIGNISTDYGYGSGNVSLYSSWRIASNSYGSSSLIPIYVNGNILNSDIDSGSNNASYNLYPSVPCFLEGTTVLCQVGGVEKYLPVEELTNETLVKTSLNGFKKVVLLGKGSIQNPGDSERSENRLYKCSTSKYPELKEDLYITGCHSILESSITEKQKEDIIKHLSKIFITDKKYRLTAYVDERAEPWNSKGEYTIWHFALENENERANYGVYVNGGLLVETCSICFLKNKSNMTLK